MLVLNRRIGQSIYLGDAICVTVFAIQRDRIVIAVMAPAAVQVRSQGTAACPAIHDDRVLSDDERPYLLALRSGDTFSVDASEIRVTFTRSALSTLRKRPGRVQLAIHAPAHLAVHREEIYARIQTAPAQATTPQTTTTQTVTDRRAPALSPAKRLQRASVSIARPSGAIPAWADAGVSAPADAEFVFA